MNPHFRLFLITELSKGILTVVTLKAQLVS
jgi:hypothetical protein